MKAVLTLKRDTYTNKSTIGKLYVNDLFICDTLEDVCRDLNKDGDLSDQGETKIYGETAIPSGIYKMIINMSPRFKKLLPRLEGVAGYSGVLIHSGNFAKDTNGCILVGTRGVDCLLGGTSMKALAKLMQELTKYTEYQIIIIDKK
jgi:hypothetical protein